MTLSVLSAILLLAYVIPLTAAQSSCNGRCGEEYYRGYQCNCDYDCLIHDECCKDYESQCTTKGSCKGRCGESFKRGKRCTCDADCQQYNQCCPDFKSFCDAEETYEGPAYTPVKTSSCNNVNDNKPTEPSQNQPEEQPKMNPLDTGENQDGNQDLSEDTLSPINPESPQDPDDAVQDETYPNTPTDPELEAVPISESTSGNKPSPSDLSETVPSEPLPSLTTPRVDSQDGSEAAAEEAYTAPSEDQEGSAGLSDAPAPQADANPSPKVPASEAPQLNATDSSGPEKQPYSSQIPSVSETTTPGSSTTSQPPDQISPSPTPQTNPSPAETSDLQPEGQGEAQPEAQNVDTPSNDTEPQDAKENSSSPVSENGPKSSPEPEGDAPNSVDDTGAQDEPPKSSSTSAQEKDKVALEEITTDPVRPNPSQTNPSPTKATLPKTTSKPKTKPPKASAATDTADALGKYNPTDYQADDSNNTDLCSGRPANAVTTLKNGTVVVFRGHYFWTLDSYRNPGPARGITDVWGIPSPIDTVYTRCNCQGKTYIFKGAQYWRFDNGEVDSGYPILVKTGFDGLQGQITAALSVPEYRRRAESVYFFKRGGLVQKYSYKQGTGSTCGRNVHNPLISLRNRVAREAVPPLESAISISVSWKGFPSTVTSAVSIPNRMTPEGYNYYIFSRSKYYSVKMDADRPVLKNLMSTSPEKNSAKSFFNCPKTV